MAETFLIAVAGGMLMSLGVGRVDLMAGRFVRLVGVLTLALSTGVFVSLLRTDPLDNGALAIAGTALALGTAIAAAALTAISGLPWNRLGVVRFVVIAGGVMGIAASDVCAIGSDALADTFGFAIVHLIGQVLAAMLLGSVTVAWLLGHAYLTATKMSITPLRSLSKLLSVSVALRCVYLVAAGLVLMYGHVADGGMSTRLLGSWLVLSLRICVGLIAVAVFAYMVRDCVKLRSTQSATGILYFASIFVYIGELSSRYLAGELGLPL